MSYIRAYVFEELDEEIQNKVRAGFLEDIVRHRLETLGLMHLEGDISEDEYYEELGCDKAYAESTAWFVPACYYDAHEKSVDEEVEATLRYFLFQKDGSLVGDSKDVVLTVDTLKNIIRVYKTVMSDPEIKAKVMDISGLPDYEIDSIGTCFELKEV